MSQEKLQTMVMQKFWGVIEVYYDIVQVVNWKSSQNHFVTSTMYFRTNPPSLRVFVDQSMAVRNKYIKKLIIIGTSEENYYWVAVWQTQSRNGGHLFGVIIFFFFRVGKSLACHSPGKWYLFA